MCREIAKHLLNNGQASAGYGDILFRTSKEWSEIGKFERQQVKENNYQNEIRIAKVVYIIFVIYVTGSIASMYLSFYVSRKICGIKTLHSIVYPHP